MSDKARIHSRLNAANNLEFFDQSTHERVFALAALFYEDDFLAAGKQAFPTTATQGIDWVKKLVETLYADSRRCRQRPIRSGAARARRDF